ncbi:phosphatase PAP2 family protein [Rhodoferax sp.]|uniref:phosphatase PAP2 family protein n=1 Tax=Rhodoferax sp. TaxID=50421 RepID=UPI003BB6224E
MPAHPTSAPGARPDQAPQAIPLSWWLVALALVVAGALLHGSPWNQAALLWGNSPGRLPDDVWAGLTLLAFGWAALILVAAADRGVEGGRAVLLAFLLGGGLSQVLKAWFGQPRPGLVLPEGALHFIGNPVLHSPSMPSGHALAAFSIATLWVCLLRRDGRSRWLQALAWALGAAMAFSRVAVGAHWPADVLVGAGLGLAIAALCWQLQARWLRHGGWMSVWVPLVAVELLGALAAFTAREGYPQVQVLQWALGLTALASAGWRLATHLGQRRYLPMTADSGTR